METTLLIWRTIEWGQDEAEMLLNLVSPTLTKSSLYRPAAEIKHRDEWSDLSIVHSWLQTVNILPIVNTLKNLYLQIVDKFPLLYSDYRWHTRTNNKSNILYLGVLCLMFKNILSYL